MLTASSIARELVLLSGLPRRIETHTVMRACATSIQSAVDIARSITAGTADVGIAGGTESMSDPPIFASRPLAHALVSASKAKNLPARLKTAEAGFQVLAAVPGRLQVVVQDPFPTEPDELR